MKDVQPSTMPDVSYQKQMNVDSRSYHAEMDKLPQNS